MIGRPYPVTGSLESPVLLARVRTGPTLTEDGIMTLHP